jgi:HK97 family phage major capsid protein
MFVKYLCPIKDIAAGAIAEVPRSHAQFLIDREKAIPAQEGEQLNQDAQKEARKILAQRFAKDAVADTFQEKGNDPQYFGDFINACARGDAAYLQQHYKSEWGGFTGTPITTIGQKAALTETSGLTGGNTVPLAMAEPILALARTRAIFRTWGAISVPFAGRDILVPAPDTTTAQTAGTPPWFGGMSFTWTPEAALRTESEPALKELELCKWELAGTLTVSRPLYDDGKAFPSFLQQLLGLAVAYYEDRAFFQGSGAGQPTGVINAPATLAKSRDNANQISFNDVASMQSKLLPQSFSNAVWAFSPSAVPQLLQLKDGANRSIFLSMDQAANKYPAWSLLGRPAIPTDALPALGTRGDLCLLDPSLYLIGDHIEKGGTLEIAASEHVNFLKNQIVIRVTRRVDGRPWLDKPVTLSDGSTLASPFVVLN